MWKWMVSAPAGSAEHDEVVLLLEDDNSGRVAAYIQTLRRLPNDPPWILVSGLAVNARVGRTYRATNDIDTVSPDQDRLVEILVAFPDTEAMSAAKVQFHDSEVEVDVMDSTDAKELPLGYSEGLGETVRSLKTLNKWLLALRALGSAHLGHRPWRSRGRRRPSSATSSATFSASAGERAAKSASAPKGSWRQPSPIGCRSHIPY
jgi:hypothetical protein